MPKLYPARVILSTLKRNVFIPKLIKIFSLEGIKIIEVKKGIILAVLEKMQKQKIDFTGLYLANIASFEQFMSFDQDFKKLFRK